MPKYHQDCQSCMSNSGKKRISPSEPIWKGKYWLVEHAYPCGMEGWLVLLPDRHVNAMHELTDKEMKEFGEIFPKLSTALHKILDNEKEYVMQLAEGEGFNHVHFHVIAKPKNLPKKYRSTGIFTLKNDVESLPENVIKDFCKLMEEELKDD